MHRVTKFDGLRAVAVLTVIQQHWGTPAITSAIGPGGWGVQCFFVLSGFLITGILMRAKDVGDCSASLVTFYLRRALRIFPAYYLVLVIAGLITTDVSDAWPWHAAYLSNVKLALDQRWPGSAAHLWSLSVEEQFYLLWPAVVFFTPRRRLEPVVLAIVLAAPLWRLLVVTITGGNQFAAMHLLTGVSDSLGIGAWLACRNERTTTALSARVFYVGVLGYLAGSVATALEAVWHLRMMFAGVSSALIFAWVIDHVARDGRGTGWLNWRPLVSVGTISYGVYLIHNFVPDLTALVSPGAAAWMYAKGVGPLVAVTALSILLATISWIALERPLNNLKRHLPYATRARETSVDLVVASS